VTVLPGLALLALIALAAKGIAMMRDPGPAQRVAPLNELERAEPLPRPGPITRLVRVANARFGPVLAGVSRPKRREYIRHLIDTAGRPGGMTLEAYTEQKVALTLAALFAGVILALLGLVLILPGLLIIGWLWPDFRLARIARARQARIEKDLPDFLDILAVTVGAGVAFRPAVTRVCEALGGPVAEEMTMALRQIDFGAGSREAMEDVRRRNESEALEEFITAVLQAEELGAPLAGTLVEQAADMRKAAYQRARRRAQRAAPRVSLVVTTMIVPASMVLVAVAIFLSSDVDLGGLFGE
jgi:tight adherence protein C